MKGISKKFIVPLLFFPVIAFGATNASLGDLLKSISTTLLNPLVTALLTLALLAFFWGMITYIRSQGTEKKQGKDIMIWGIIGLAVMVSVWGLVNLVIGTFGVNQNSTITIPTIPSNSTN